MVFFWILISVLILIMAVVILIPLKVLFSVNQENFIFQFSWLNKFLNGYIKEENNKIFITIELLKKQLLKKQLKLKSDSQPKKKSKFNVSMLKSIKPKYIGIQTSYGFEDPSVTGFITMLTNQISNFFKIDDINNKPNFDSGRNYFDFRCLLKFNIFTTLLKIFKFRTKTKIQPTH